jgi:hypothetical protein
MRESVFELPGRGVGWGVGGGGLNPQLFAQPPNKIPWGVSFNPPPLLMMLNRLCVMTMTMNRQMSIPHLLFDNSNPGASQIGILVTRLGADLTDLVATRGVRVQLNSYPARTRNFSSVPDLYPARRVRTRVWRLVPVPVRTSH